MNSERQKQGVLSAEFRKRFWWPPILALALFAYLYGLGSIHIPKIGDEAPYIQTVRLTAQSGHWLSLHNPPGLPNTKPPLLFWQGMIATQNGAQWSLLRLRLPIVLYTFLITGLVFLLAKRMSGDSEPGYLAALSFLGFFSTFQHGRPFLTNMPETFFVFLPFFCALYFGSDRINPRGWLFWLLAGLSFGMAFLYKSFALAAPVGLALAWICLARETFKTFVVLYAPRIALALLVGLACFALWPLLDPDPKSIFTHFILGENVGKLSKGHYFRELFWGDYTAFRIWLGNLANAGFLALPLIGVVVVAIKKRAVLSFEQKALWILVLSFTIFFTIPAQRQENYLLPTVPALAVLLGTGWMSLPRKGFYFFVIPPLMAVIALMVIIYSISFRFLPDSYSWWQLLVPLVALLLGMAAFVCNRAAPYVFHLVIVLMLISLTCALDPFYGPLGRYTEETIAALKGKTVYIPSNFRASHERHRFLLPGAEVEGYDQNDMAARQRLLDLGESVAVYKSVNESIEGPYEVLGRCLTLRSRQTNEEIMRLIFHNQLDLLIQQEVILRRADAGQNGRGQALTSPKNNRS